MLIAVRFALYLDLMLVFGLPLFVLYTMRGAEYPTSSTVLSSRASFALLLIGAALSVFGLLLLAAAMSDVPLVQLDRETLYALLNGTAIGTAGKIRVGVLLIALPISVWPKARPRARWVINSFLGAVALGSLAWAGHGAADDGPRGLTHLIADIGHLLAAGVWIGALAGLLILLLEARAGSNNQHERTALAHRALAGFGPVGAFCVALITLTGLINSWFLVGLGNILSLAGTTYGRLLILKLIIFAGMLSLAGLNRFRLTPAIEASLGDANAAAVAMRSIKRSVTLETGFALIVLGLVAWLGAIAPPSSS